MKMKKPNLAHAEIIKKTSLSDIPKSMLKIMSPEAKKALEKNGAKEIATNNMAVGEWFVIERYLPGNYHKFARDGSRSELSVFEWLEAVTIFMLSIIQERKRLRITIRFLMKPSYGCLITLEKQLR